MSTHKTAMLGLAAATICAATWPSASYAQERQISEFSDGKSHKYQLSVQEHAVFKTLLADEAKNFAAGENSLIGARLGTVTVSSASLAKAYKANEVAADKSYKGKQLLVTGKIDRIHSGIGGSPYFALGSGGDAPQAAIRKDSADYAATAQRGQTVRLVCVGGGATLGAPMLKECVPADAVAKAEVTKLTRQADILLSNARTNASAAQVVAASIAISSALQPSECTQEGAVCLKAIGRVTAAKDFPQKLRDAIATLKAAGIDMPT
ncbi:OB-fold protein [Achromobacter xylosoxidans]